MKNNTSISGNIGVQVVAAILSVVAIILGIAAMTSGSSNKNTVKELQTRLDGEMSTIEQVQTDMQKLKTQTQNGFTSLATEIGVLRDQMTKKPEPVAAVKDNGKKDKAKDEGTSAGPGTQHTVKSRETLAKIAKEYGTTVAAIEKLNPNVNSKHLKVGQKIRVK